MSTRLAPPIDPRIDPRIAHPPVATLAAGLVAIHCAVIATITRDADAQAAGILHFESPQIHPLALSGNGRRVAAVNTADHRVEIFEVLDGAPYLRHMRSIPVGLEPVTVRARGESEIWAVNHVSDSITIIDAEAGTVLGTIPTGDEPCDVVFAGKPERAFVSISQRNQVAVYDTNDLSIAPTLLDLEGEDPRALATDGERVYAAFAECGNDTTIIDFHAVRALQGIPFGVPAVPPNRADGTFFPPLNPANPPMLESSLILKRDIAGAWRDETGRDWSAAVTWDLHGNDLAVIDPQTLSRSYLGGLMTTPLAMTDAPGGGVVVVGTEAHNHIRFEPNLNGLFATVEAVHIDATGSVVARTDLNPHIDGSVRQLPLFQRLQSFGDPRGVAIAPDGSTVLLAGMGSSNLLATSLDGFTRKALLPETDGPTGIAIDAARARVYTLQRFDGSITVRESDNLAPLGTARYFDPTPTAIKEGRRVLFDTHLTSGLGHVSCATCHVDARMDQLAWDLGDPSGPMETFFGDCNDTGGTDACDDFHPLKGPMTTQTLIGIDGNEPFHWRGDRADLAAFAHAAETILSRPTSFTAQESAALEAYLDSIRPMPNPNRSLRNELPTNLDGGDAVAGMQDFVSGLAVANGAFNCTLCHRRPDGSSGFIVGRGLTGEPHDLKAAPIRSVYDKTGFDRSSNRNNRGFGMIHDGSIGTVDDFLDTPLFVFAGDPVNGPQRQRNMRALMLSWDTGTHAGVGAHIGIGPSHDGNDILRRDVLVQAAETTAVDLVVRVSTQSGSESYLYRPAASGATVAGFIGDVAGAEPVDTRFLDDLALAGAFVGYILVPQGSGAGLLDRDGDGYLDGDERNNCTDPANARSHPGGTCRYDIAGSDGRIDGADLAVVLSAWGTFDSVANVDCVGPVDGADLAAILSAWGVCN